MDDGTPRRPLTRATGHHSHARLVALNRTEQLRFHLQHALENGVTADELVEAITHLAFYSGWPTAMSAAILAKDVFKQDA